MKWDGRITRQIHAVGADSIGFWIFLSKFGLYGFVIALFVVAFAIKANGAVIFWFAPAAAAFVVTFFLRYMIRRPRPHFMKPKYTPLLRAWSFPSAHSSVALAFATTLSIIVMQGNLAFGFICSFLFFILAILISLSRITVGVHYFTDVLAGALLGIVISVTLVVV
ncbi:phosphatase PAP2 family protein [Patescibacteria group bacterium]|nr:phosphatase PAP2 family protein [Patescibacteria group bacterium]